jgi:urease accessory protein
MDSDEETYILLLLADGNLPTGSFVASSGLESYMTHGFFARSSIKSPLQSLCEFVEDSLGTYARTASPFVTDTHRVLFRAARGELTVQGSLAELIALDDFYEVMTLNHVARRASRSQGVALLTLYSKGFANPSGYPSTQSVPHDNIVERMGQLVDELKIQVRKGNAQGHLPICWGVLTAALGLQIGTLIENIDMEYYSCHSERSLHLHLFLHARGLISAAVRLNAIGPYAAQQLLLHTVKPLVERVTRECHGLRTALPEKTPSIDPPHSHDTSMSPTGPATTWPLGEILATRHDLQHSRVFNS